MLKKILQNNLIYRFDIIVKYLYIKSYLSGSNFEYYRELYRKHEIMYNGGIEDDKQNIQDFEQSFISLIESIKKNGFNKKHPVLVDKNTGRLLNGSHRIACCAYFEIDPIIKTSTGNISGWDFNWFKQNHFSSNELRDILYGYGELLDDYYVAMIWPTFMEQKDNILDIISKKQKIIGNYTLSLTPHTLSELVYDTYGFDHGAIPGLGIEEKVVFLKKFKPECEIALIHIESFNKKEIIFTKSEIRDFYVDKIDYLNKESIGFFIMHSSDRKNERDYMRSLLLSNTNIKYLNYRDNVVPSKNLMELLKLYDKTLKKNNINKQDSCIVKGSILEVFGLKKSADIDFITYHVDKSKQRVVNIGDRVDLANHRYLPDVANSYIIDNPENHFYFRGYRFTTLDILKQSKKLEGRSKDLVHIKLIEDFLNGKNQNSIKKMFMKKRLLLLFIIRRMKVIGFHQIRNFLKKIGLYKIVSYYWRKYILKNMK